MQHVDPANIRFTHNSGFDITLLMDGLRAFAMASVSLVVPRGIEAFPHRSAMSTDIPLLALFSIQVLVKN